MVRLATAALLAPALWVVIKLAPAGLFLGFACAISGLATWECYRMLEASAGRPLKELGLVAIGALGWSFAGFEPRLELGLALVGLVLASLLLSMLLRAAPAAMLEATLHTVFPVVLIGVGLGYLIGLRGLPGEDGKDALLLLFICVIFADTAAFYVGSALGRRPFAPRLSPSKTWEGAIGGLAGSLAGALVAHVWFYQRLSLAHALALGLILGVAAIVGDLSESMIKRAVGVKDSSSLLPGHGGVLDRTDSLLFAGPVLYYYYRAFLQGTP